MTTQCACHSTDRFYCWASRYNMNGFDCQAIKEDGGPCECICHDEADQAAGETE